MNKEGYELINRIFDSGGLINPTESLLSYIQVNATSSAENYSRVFEQSSIENSVKSKLCAIGKNLVGWLSPTINLSIMKFSVTCNSR